MSFSVKPFFILLAVTLAGSSTLYADTTTSTTSTSSDSGLLQQIADNTYNMLAQINNLPTYMNSIVEMAQSWLTTDDDATNSFIAQNQGDFASLGYWFSQNAVTQASMATQTMAYVVNQPITAFTQPERSPDILTSIPTVNSLAYSSLVGAPPIDPSKAAFDPNLYLQAASGAAFNHATPSSTWQGKPRDYSAYSAYFRTVTAAESFNAYVMSGLVAENQSGNQIQTLLTNLTNQATSSAWLAQIATEELGKVIRQILLFESQNFVLMSQLVKIEKQQLQAQTMTNALLIATGFSNERLMASAAQGIR